MSDRFSHTIYVGNLPSNIRELEVEDLFYKYGRILAVELKIPYHSPRYCFIEFENSRDVEYAIKGRDGYNFDSCCLRDELAYGSRGQSSSNHQGGFGGDAASLASHVILNIELLFMGSFFYFLARFVGSHAKS